MDSEGASIRDSSRAVSTAAETVAVVIVTFNRPDCLRVCLEHLAAQSRPADEIIVVDSSTDERSHAVLSDFPSVRYLRNPSGPGHMTQSRNIGYRESTSDIIAFVDDDGYASPDWLANLLATYRDETDAGAVGGRTVNLPRPVPADAIGRLYDDGSLTGNFDASPSGRVEVDHLIGCNMSFRRSALDSLGGFRESFPGTALREDSDICLRVKASGWKIVFEPAAHVDHVGAPHVIGRRFDVRYQYFAQRNHVAMLIWNFRFGPTTRRYLVGSARTSARAFAGGALKLPLWAAATVAGITAGVRGRRHTRSAHGDL